MLLMMPAACLAKRPWMGSRPKPWKPLSSERQKSTQHQAEATCIQTRGQADKTGVRFISLDTGSHNDHSGLTPYAQWLTTELLWLHPAGI
jgi:hypothetical protein